MTMNYCVKTLAAGIAITGGLVVLPATPAYAQSYSRICGYTATTSTGAVGLVYEARTEDNSYTKQCDDALTSIWSTIQKDASLKQLKWTKHYKNKCEDVGALFVTSKVGSDICDPMEAKQHYKITKTTSSDSTTFVRQ